MARKKLREKQVYAFLMKNQEASILEISKHMKLGYSGTRNVVEGMVEEEKLSYKGEGTRGSPYVFFLNGENNAASKNSQPALAATSAAPKATETSVTKVSKTQKRKTKSVAIKNGARTRRDTAMMVLTDKVINAIVDGVSHDGRMTIDPSSKVFAQAATIKALSQ